MKRRLSAVLLAAGLTVSALSMGVYAEETETAATEQVTEAVSEAETEAGAGADQSAKTETVQSEPATPEEMAKNILEAQLSQISAWTDDQIDQLIESDDITSQAVAGNWKSVKEELGAFVEVTDAQLNAEGTEITGNVKYDKLDDKTTVAVTYAVNPDTQTATVNWDIQYPMSVLMQRAGLNTVMGLGIVFLTLLFLSALIAQLHIIPDMIEKRAKKNAPAPTPAPTPAPIPAAQEEDLTDDLELVAVITAAIAASENTSSDGFVVRSIKKANKRNWHRA
ncbi:MAG: OadG family protein [Lachnospiraceae bacterium]|nr:OadG family protein [Lachnospiraceae bacterium]